MASETPSEVNEQVDGGAATARSVDVHPEVARLIAEHGGAGALPERMGIRLTRAEPDAVVGTMPVEGNTQPYGLLHGGASCVLAETLGSVCAALNAGPDGRVVGVDINATHHRSAMAGTVTGTARPVYVGRSVGTFEVVLTDDNDRRLCTARLTCMIRRG